LWGQPVFRFPSETVAEVVIGDVVTELDGSFVLNTFLFGEGMSTMEEIMDEIPNGGKLPVTKKEVARFMEWVPSDLLMRPTGQLELEFEFAHKRLSHQAMTASRTLAKRFNL
jgi:hypothetical protein